MSGQEQTDRVSFMIRPAYAETGTEVWVDDRPVANVNSVTLKHEVGDVPTLEIGVHAHDITAVGDADLVLLVGTERFTPADVKRLRQRDPDPAALNELAGRLARVMGLE